MRFSSGAPRQRAHSNERFDDHVLARVTITSDRPQQPTARVQPGAETGCRVAFSPLRQATACRRTTPCGTSPVVTIRHNAISSLRARATIRTVLRTPWTPVRARYH